MKPESAITFRRIIPIFALLCVFVAGALLTLGITQEQVSVLVGAVVALVAAALFGFLSVPSPEQRRKLRTAEEHERDLHSANQRAHALVEMSNTLGGTLDYNRVLEVALGVGEVGLRASIADARLIAMVLLFENQQRLRVAMARGLTTRDASATVPGQKGILGQALGQAEPVYAANCADDPELSYFVAFQDARSVLVVPLRAGFQNYGLLVFGATEPSAFSTEHNELLAAIGTQATIALQNAVLYQDLVQEKERIIAVEEDARKKLARDLHDGPTQQISAIAMRVNYIRMILTKDPTKAVDELRKVEEIAQRTTKEIRHMLFTLRPLVLENQGLRAALEQFKQKMHDTHNLSVSLNLDPAIESLLPVQGQGVLFYIIEEAINNARKHAQAGNHWVRIYRRETYMICEIEDDGVGFDVSAVDAGYDQRGSLGMVNMRERAALIGGTLLIDSERGRGTRISVLVPLAISTSPAPTGSAPDDTLSRRLAQHANAQR